MSLITSNINLYLMSPPISQASGQIYGFVEGKTNENVLGSFFMLMAASPPSGSSINLYISGESVLREDSASINFYLEASPIEHSSNIAFYMPASISSGVREEESIRFFTSGSGITENTTPLSSSINMFLATSPGAENSFPCLISGNDTKIDNINMYILGIEDSILGTLSLHTSGKTAQNESLRLFIRGYNS
jgi:hypothetical protein